MPCARKVRSVKREPAFVALTVISVHAWCMHGNQDHQHRHGGIQDLAPRAQGPTRFLFPGDSTSLRGPTGSNGG